MFIIDRVEAFRVGNIEINNFRIQNLSKIILKNIFVMAAIFFLLSLVFSRKIYASAIIQGNQTINPLEIEKKMVAVVGNSNGSLFSFFNNVDRDDSVEWQNECFSNNAAEGDTVCSIRVYPNSTTQIFATFPLRAHLYDYAIVWIGTNEIQYQINVNTYNDYLVRWVSDVISANPNIKILLMQIPLTRNNAYARDYAVDVSKFNDINRNVASSYSQVDFVDYSEVEPKVIYLNDIAVHLSYRTLINIWNLIRARYRIDAYYNPRDIDTNAETYKLFVGLDENDPNICLPAA